MTCPECGLENPPSARHCDCGHPFDGGPRRTAPASEKEASLNSFHVMLGIFAVAFLVWIFSTTGPENKAPAAAEAHDESPEACLGIKDTSVSSNESVTVITGIVVNGCDRDFDTVRIKFKLSDQDGNVVGSASAEQKGLLRGERWKYTAAAPVPSYRRKLVELTGF